MEAQSLSMNTCEVVVISDSLESIQIQLHPQILHSPIAFDAITRAAQQLQILDMVGPSLTAWDDVVNLQMPRIKVMPAALAIA